MRRATMVMLVLGMVWGSANARAQTAESSLAEPAASPSSNDGYERSLHERAAALEAITRSQIDLRRPRAYGFRRVLNVVAMAAGIGLTGAALMGMAFSGALPDRDERLKVVLVTGSIGIVGAAMAVTGFFAGRRLARRARQADHAAYSRRELRWVQQELERLRGHDTR